MKYLWIFEILSKIIFHMKVAKVFRISHQITLNHCSSTVRFKRTNYCLLPSLLFFILLFSFVVSCCCHYFVFICRFVCNDVVKWRNFNCFHYIYLHLIFASLFKNIKIRVQEKEKTERERSRKTSSNKNCTLQYSKFLSFWYMHIEHVYIFNCRIKFRAFLNYNVTVLLLHIRFILFFFLLFMSKKEL